jgi:release factor glutamine methyltransferase
VTKQPLRVAILEAERVLGESGVDSARVEAEILAAHVLGVERWRLPLVPMVDPSVVDALREVVSRRARRVPLQHLLGTAYLAGVEVEVGPGVFVPRPETELLQAWAVAEVAGGTPTVVDLCTGSGVLALAIAQARPEATVHAVDVDPAALSWAQRNADLRRAAGDTPIHLHRGDVTDPGLLADLAGTVDLVVCNPPYVPSGTPVPPEVSEHDPAVAVFAGADGLDVIRHVIERAARLLRPGGLLAVEHDDSHGESVPALLRAHGAFTEVADHPDLAGRPRFATAARR